MKFFCSAKNKNSGFTLIELLVVIAIIGLLATIVMVSVNSARAKSRDAKRQGDIQSLYKALQMYYDDNSSFPSTPSGGWRCVGLTDGQTCWGGTVSGLTSLMTALSPYVKSLPVDPNSPTGAYFYASNSATTPPTAYLQWYFENASLYNNTSACSPGAVMSPGSSPYCQATVK